MSPNVPGMRRLGQAIGLCEANVPCPKCGGDKTAQRAHSPAAFFTQPGADRLGRRSVYRVLNLSEKSGFNKIITKKEKACYNEILWQDSSTQTIHKDNLFKLI